MPDGQRVLDNLRSYAKNGKVVLFIGSGLSQPTFPSWDGLVQAACQKAGLSQAARGSAKKVEILSECRRVMGEASWRLLVSEIFNRQLTKEDIPVAYKALADLPIRHILTTNFDLLPNCIWAGWPIYGNSNDELKLIMEHLKSDSDYQSRLARCCSIPG